MAIELPIHEGELICAEHRSSSLLRKAKLVTALSERDAKVEARGGLLLTGRVFSVAIG
jgi:hypothetical protein